MKRKESPCVHAGEYVKSPVSNTQAFNFLFNIFNTVNSTGDAVLDGDKLRFSGGLLSNNTFNYDGVDYALELVGFSNNGGTSLVNEFNSPEGSIAFASLYGKFTALTPQPQQPSQPQQPPQAEQPSQPQQPPQAEQPPQTEQPPQAEQPTQSKSVPEPTMLVGLSLLGLYLGIRHRQKN